MVEAAQQDRVALPAPRDQAGHVRHHLLHRPHPQLVPAQVGDVGGAEPAHRVVALVVGQHRDAPGQIAGLERERQVAADPHVLAVRCRAAPADPVYQPPGDGLLRADYLCGEDVVRGVTNPTNGIRSLANPTAYGHPDHYSIRFLGDPDNGGVHINSGIANHAFYLAVEGGTHRLSGIAVEGVGGANREQVEKVFYRAFTQLMTASSTFAVARAATIQAARDLYGDGSPAERAVAQAWSAVGVN